jgi:hypothetical protein
VWSAIWVGWFTPQARAFDVTSAGFIRLDESGFFIGFAFQVDICLVRCDL